MIVYSKKIIRFIDEIKRTIKEVLSREVGLEVSRDRFYDARQWASYPIKVVIYNDKSLLGYFDSDFLELGFHEALMHSSKEQLLNVIRHELAHYITFVNHGETARPHPFEFKAFCERMGWGEEVYRAAAYLERGKTSTEVEESSILRKVQKLMALATSSNENEAEQAMIKAQQLLLKHNIESTYMGEDEERIVLKRIMGQRKQDAKMDSIARILETFFVNTVYNRGGEFTYLEVCGDKVNVEIAEYVANFLYSELDRLWKQAQQKVFLRGAVAKNSFFLGLAKGYCNKIQALKREYNNNVANALVVIEKKLTDAKKMAYQRLTLSRSSRGHCPQSSALGEKMGRQLSINPAVNQSSNRGEESIAYQGS